MCESFKYYGRHNYLYAVIKDSSNAAYIDKGVDKVTHDIPFGYTVVPLFQGYKPDGTVRVPYGVPNVMDGG